MSTHTTPHSPYESLSKYSESLIHCPLCYYYFKIYPQTDTMKYRLISHQKIHFLTQHSFNDSIHIVVIEYLDFSFSKIISSQNVQPTTPSDSLIPLYHLVNLSEYKTFRDRIHELECNNNDLIANFKSKLDILELNYNKKTDEILLLDQSNIMMNVQNSLPENEPHLLRDEFLHEIQQTIEALQSDNHQLQFQVNVRLKFSDEQYQVGLQIQVLNIVFSELCKYIFDIIKSVKASLDSNSFKIVPDDASNLQLISTHCLNDKISFTIRLANDFHVSDSFRVFRPTSELYKHALIFITCSEGIFLTNSNYQLIPHQLIMGDNEIVIEIQNFFDTNDSFQIGFYEENNCFIIQKNSFKEEFNFFRDFAENNKLSSNYR